jgi:hypothetical protein
MRSSVSALEHIVEGTKSRVYSPAKTVADCFKFRSKIRTELAIRALRECFREKYVALCFLCVRYGLALVQKEKGELIGTQSD